MVCLAKGVNSYRANSLRLRMLTVNKGTKDFILK